MKDSYSKKALGERGEDLAVDYLTKAEVKIVKRNYRCPKGELDIIAQEGDTIIFVEVRLRTSGFRGYAQESIDHKKFLRLQRIAEYFLVEQGFIEWPSIRFDLIAINWEGENPAIKWIRNIM